MSHRINVSDLLTLLNTEMFFFIYLYYNPLSKLRKVLYRSLTKYMNHFRNSRRGFGSVSAILADWDFKLKRTK